MWSGDGDTYFCKVPEMQAGRLHRNAKSLINTMNYFQTHQPDKIEQSIAL